MKPTRLPFIDFHLSRKEFALGDSRALVDFLQGLSTLPTRFRGMVRVHFPKFPKKVREVDIRTDPKFRQFCAHLFSEVPHALYFLDPSHRANAVIVNGAIKSLVRVENEALGSTVMIKYAPEALSTVAGVIDSAVDFAQLAGDPYSQSGLNRMPNKLLDGVFGKGWQTGHAHNP